MDHSVQGISSSNIQEIIGQMLKNLQCPICLELMNCPVSTNCNHRFCSYCINSFFKTQRVLPCPLCNASVTKRSIEEQSQLSSVIKCIRQLIDAYETDTGAQFSPVKNASTFFPSTPEALVTRRKSNSKRKYQAEEGTRELKPRSCSSEKAKDQGSSKRGTGRKLSENAGARKRIPYHQKSSSNAVEASTSNENNEALTDIFTGLDSDTQLHSSPPETAVPSALGISSLRHPKKNNRSGRKETSASETTGTTMEQDSRAKLLHYLHEGSCGGVTKSIPSDQTNNNNIEQCEDGEKKEKRSSLLNNDTIASNICRGRRRKSDITSSGLDNSDKVATRHHYSFRKTPVRSSSNTVPTDATRAESPQFIPMQTVTRTYSREMKQAFRTEKVRARSRSNQRCDEDNSVYTAPEQANDPLGLPPAQVLDLPLEEKTAETIPEVVDNPEFLTPKEADNSEELTGEQLETSEDAEEQNKDVESVFSLQKNLRRGRDTGRDMEFLWNDCDMKTPPTTRPTRNKIFKNKNEQVNNGREMQEKTNCPTLTLSQDPFAFVGETPVKEKKTGTARAKKGQSKKLKNPLAFHKSCQQIDNGGFIDEPPADVHNEGNIDAVQESKSDQVVSDSTNISMRRSVKSTDARRKTRRKGGKPISPENGNSTNQATIPPVSKLWPEDENMRVGKADGCNMISIGINTQAELFSGQEDDYCDETITRSTSTNVATTQKKSVSKKKNNSGQKRMSERKNQPLSETEKTDDIAIASQEFKKMRSKISEAETHDLMFSTQEARQYMQKQQDTANTQEDEQIDFGNIESTAGSVVQEFEINSCDNENAILIPSQPRNREDSTTQNEKDATSEKVTQCTDIIMESCRQREQIDENRQQILEMETDNDTEKADDLLLELSPNLKSQTKDLKLSEQRQLLGVSTVLATTNRAQIIPIYSLPNLASMTEFHPLSIGFSGSPAISSKTNVVCESPLTSDLATNSMQNSINRGSEITSEISYSPMITKSLDNDSDVNVSSAVNVRAATVIHAGDASSKDLIGGTDSQQKFDCTNGAESPKAGLSLSLGSVNTSPVDLEKPCCDSQDHRSSKKPSMTTLSLRSNDSLGKKDEVKDTDRCGLVFDTDVDSALCAQTDVVIVAPDTCIDDPYKTREDNSYNPLGFTAVPETELPATMLEMEAVSKSGEMSQMLKSKQKTPEPIKEADSCASVSQKDEVTSKPEQILYDSQPISSTYVVAPGRKQGAANDMPEVESENSCHSNSQDSDTEIPPVTSSESLSSVMSQSFFSGGKSLMSLKEKVKAGNAAMLSSWCDSSLATPAQNLHDAETPLEIRNASNASSQETVQKEGGDEEMVQVVDSTDEGQELSDYDDTECVLMVHSRDRNSFKEMSGSPTMPVVFGTGMEEIGNGETMQPPYGQSEVSMETTCEPLKDATVVILSETNEDGLAIGDDKDQNENRPNLLVMQGLENLEEIPDVRPLCNNLKPGTMSLSGKRAERKNKSLKGLSDGSEGPVGRFSGSENQSSAREPWEDKSQSILVVPGKIKGIDHGSDAFDDNKETKLSLQDGEHLSKHFTPSKKVPQSPAEESTLLSKDWAHCRQEIALPSENQVQSLGRNLPVAERAVMSSPGNLTQSGELELVAQENLTSSSQENSTPLKKRTNVSRNSLTPSTQATKLAEENSAPSKEMEEVATENSTPFKDHSSIENSTSDKKLGLSKKKTRRGLATRSSEKKLNPLPQHPKGRLLPSIKAALDLEFSGKNKMRPSMDKDPELAAIKVGVEDNQLNTEVETILESRSDRVVTPISQNSYDKENAEIGQQKSTLESGGRENALVAMPSGCAVGGADSWEDPNHEPVVPQGENSHDHVVTKQTNAGKDMLTQAQQMSVRFVSTSPDIELSFDLGISMDVEDNDLDRVNPCAASGKESQLDNASQFDDKLLGKSQNSSQEDSIQDGKSLLAVNVLEAIDESDLEDSQMAVLMTSSPLKATGEASQDFQESIIFVEEDNDTNDSEEHVAPSKKRRRLQITSDSEDESELEPMDCSPGNATSSSAFSSQSELMTTQQQEALAVDVATLQQEIAQCEAALENGNESGGPSTNAAKVQAASSSKTDEEITVDENGNREAIHVNTGNEMRTADEENSDDDLFICTSSPSPPKRKQPQLTLQRLAAASKESSAPESRGLKNKFYKQFQSPGGSLHKRRNLEFTQQLTKSDGLSDNDNNTDNNKSSSSMRNAPTSPVLLSQAKRYRKSLSKTKNEVNSTRLSSSCENVLLVSSGLKAHEQEMLQIFKHRFHLKFSARFVPDVTHVIVKSVEGFGFVCERTLKFFRGLAHKTWVVDFSWIIQSLEEGHMLKEDEFEIQGDTSSGEFSFGPKKARLSTQPLLADYSFACVGSCGELPQNDLKELLFACGANVVGDLIALPLSTAKYKFIIRCNDSDEEPNSLELAMLSSVYQQTGAATLNRDWVLDCISAHRIIPVSDYQLKV